MQAYLIAALLLLIAIGVFIFQNPSTVVVHFAGWISPQISLAVVVLLAAFTGAIITFMVDAFRYFKIARKINELGTLNKKLQKQIKNMENTKNHTAIKEEQKNITD